MVERHPLAETEIMNDERPIAVKHLNRHGSVMQYYLRRGKNSTKTRHGA